MTDNSRHLSDYLPPKLVHEFRGYLRSPLFLVLGALVLLAAPFMSFTQWSGDDVYMFFSLIIVGVLPFRAGSNISHELSARGSDFLRMAPMSSWRVVGGQWLACFLPQLLLALLAWSAIAGSDNLPLEYASINPVKYLVQEPALAAMMLLAMGALANSLMLLLAGTSFLVRSVVLALFVFGAEELFFWSTIDGIVSHYGLVFRDFLYTRLFDELPIVLTLILYGALLLFLLARRHYVNPRSVRPWGLRVAAFAPLLLLALVSTKLPLEIAEGLWPILIYMPLVLAFFENMLWRDRSALAYGLLSTILCLAWGHEYLCADWCKDLLEYAGLLGLTLLLGSFFLSYDARGKGTGLIIIACLLLALQAALDDGVLRWGLPLAVLGFLCVKESLMPLVQPLKGREQKAISARGSIISRLSDFLPNALVKELRQSFKNPLYLLMLVAASAGSYLLYWDSSGIHFTFDDKIVLILGAAGVAIGAQASRSVETDTRFKGSNFLQLSPMRPLSILWGQWLSGYLQWLLFCATIVPLILWRMEADAPWQAYTCVLLLYGALCVAFMQLLAGFEFYSRLICGGGVLIFAYMSGQAAIITQLAIGQEVGSLFGIEESPTAPMLTMLMVTVLAASALCLVMARRHYQSLADQSRGLLRVLALLPMAWLLCFMELYPLSFDWMLTQYICAVALPMLVCLLDLILPREQGGLRKRGWLWALLCGSNMSAQLFYLGLTVALSLALGDYLFSTIIDFFTLPLKLMNMANFFLGTPTKVPYEFDLVIIKDAIALVIGACLYSLFICPLLLTNICLSAASRYRLTMFVVSLIFMGIIAATFSGTAFPIACLEYSVELFADVIEKEPLSESAWAEARAYLPFMATVMLLLIGVEVVRRRRGV